MRFLLKFIAEQPIISMMVLSLTFEIKDADGGTPETVR